MHGNNQFTRFRKYCFEDIFSFRIMHQSIEPNCNCMASQRHFLEGGKHISFNHPCVCRMELSNPSCFTAVCKPGSVEFTGTVRQRGLESSLRHTQGDCFFYITHLFHSFNIALFSSQYYRVNMVRINFTIFTIKEYHTRHGKRHLPYKEMSKIRLFYVNKMAAKFCSVNQQLNYYLQQQLLDGG